MSVEKRRDKWLDKRNFGRDLAATFRSPVTRSRRLEGSIDLAQLPADKPVALHKDGAPVFLLGYSRLGGDDRLG